MLINCSPVIHPDKCSHPRAPEAFDILKKVCLHSRFLSFSCFLLPLYFCCQAESELSDIAKREELDAVISQARIIVLRSLNLPSSTPSSDPKLQDLDPPFKVRLRAQSKQMLIDEEVRRRK